METVSLKNQFDIVRLEGFLSTEIRNEDIALRFHSSFLINSVLSKLETSALFVTTVTSLKLKLDLHTKYREILRRKRILQDIQNDFRRVVGQINSSCISFVFNLKLRIYTVDVLSKIHDSASRFIFRTSHISITFLEQLNTRRAWSKCWQVARTRENSHNFRDTTWNSFHRWIPLA